MKYQKLLSLLVLLMTAATGAWAQGYNVTFGGLAESEMNTTVNVTSLPYTFTAIGHDAFYPWTVISTAGNVFYNATVTSGGEGKVSANITYSDEMTITITGPFEGTATIHVTGEDDENRSISTDITVTCVAVGGNSGGSGDQTYSVTMKDGVKDADKWTITPNPAEEGQTVTLQYNGRLKVKSVKAVKKAPAPAEGKTYTNLKGGEVLHVGDKITETEGTFRSTHNDNPQESDYYTYLRSGKTYEVLRADVVDYKYTESPNGQYYVLKCTYFDYDDYEDWVTDYYFVQDLPVTGTSDGITVTLDGQDGYGQNLYTFWVHEPNQAAPAVPVTYTALSGGEVLHVGDIIEIPDGQEWRINNSYIMSSRNPLTVVRANITIDQWDELTVTEAADGAYYVIKDTGGWYYCTYEGFTLPVTGTSDGIYVTYNGILWDEYPDYTFSVHEK